MKTDRKTFLSCILVMFLWGSLFPMIKVAYAAFAIDTANYGSLLLFAGARFLLCGAVITAFSAYRKIPFTVPSAKNYFGIAAVGITAVFLHYTCTYIGLSVTDSSKTALLKQAGALLFICFSFLFFKEERFSFGKICSAFLGLVGILALNIDFSSSNVGISLSFGIGEILILIASVCSVVSNIFAKKMTVGVHSQVMTGYSQIFGGALLLAAGFITGGRFGELNLASAAVFAYICAASIFAYCLWYAAVNRADLSFLLVIKFLEPLFSAVLGSAILGEDIFKLSYLIATLAIFAAILISAFDGKKKNGQA